MKSNKKEINNFTSYLALHRSEDATVANLELKLLTGEAEVVRAPNTTLYQPTLKKNISENSIKGLLIVTNFRLAFLTNLDKTENQNAVYQENNYLGKNDVTLSNIDQIYQITDKKRKLINYRVKNNSRIDSLQIICKNFRILHFGFIESEKTNSYKIASALLKFAFPSQHNLLFSYKFTDRYYNSIHNVTFFNTKKDWVLELQRCRSSTGWRVASIEKNTETNIEKEIQYPANSLPTYFVIPKSLSDEDLYNYSIKFCDSRLPMWVYGYENASLVRMAYLDKNSESFPENILIEKIRDCHPDKKEIYFTDLLEILPSINDIQISYTKLRELCTPENGRIFLAQEQRYYSLLEKSNWLYYVSIFLKHSNEMADKMKNGQTVVLQEYKGRDTSAIISSLIQIILDPLYRTINGFQSLIQKDWIAMGHPFCERFGIVIGNNDTNERSPVFLLFLDCVWQLLKQFPEDFEFSETYLITLWDSLFLPIFDTFQFNCDYDRMNASNNENLILRPVWDWGEQFSDRDIALFTNPLYKKPADNVLNKKHIHSIPPNAVKLPIIGASNYKRETLPSQIFHNTLSQQKTEIQVTNCLENVLFSIRNIELWELCYFRWLPYLEIQNGGQPNVDVFNRIVLSNISKLQQALQTGDFDELPDSTSLISSSLMNLPTINSFFPFSKNVSHNTDELGELLINSNDIITDGSIFDGLSISQVPD